MASSRPDTAGELEGRVRDVTASGDAVIETARGLVLAPGALPQERVRVRLGARARGVRRGRVVALLEASPARVEAPCPVVARCGGCPLMTLQPEAQHELKLRHVERALARCLPQGLALEPQGLALELVPSPRSLGYRARARLSWSRRRGRAQIGYRGPRSHELVEVEHCPVLSPALDAGLRRLREGLAPQLAGQGEIILGLGSEGRAVALLQSAHPQPPALYDAARALSPSAQLAGLALQVGDAARASFGDCTQRFEDGAAMALTAPAGVFVQANPEVADALRRRVLALSEPQGQRLLELYAGCGTLTLALAAQASELVAVEADPRAAEALRENIARRGLRNVRVHCEDAAVAAAGRSVDCVVLDPPRRGAREALPGILARRPRRIVYVACDPVTLGRDLEQLTAAGYVVDAVSVLDMFPHTPHVECVVRLTR